MRPTSGCRLGFPALLTLLIFFTGAQSQSLGDLARENREKKAAEDASGSPPKVITNANLPKDPDAITTAATTGDEAQTDQQESNPTQRSMQRHANEQRVAAQWKRRILQQENTVASLRMRVDRMKAAIRFADPNYSVNGTSSDYYASQNYNRAQVQRLDRLARLQQQLDLQKRKLEDLQEAARRAGMHTAVYDP